MKFLLASMLLLSSLAFASEKMSNEAIEMAEVMTHRQVRECMGDLEIGDMVNVEIEKLTARCPGCNTYIISGSERLGGDMPLGDRTIITLEGRGQLTRFNFVQNYKCNIKRGKR